MLTGASEVMNSDPDLVRNWITGIAAIFSLGALGLGIVNFLRAKTLDKRDLFLRMHESLIEPDAVAGRRALYKIKSAKDAASACSNDATSSQIYRALALFDVMALYVESNWISQDTALKEWSNSLARSREPARLWIAERYKDVQWHSWPHYQALAAKAEGVERARRALAQHEGGRKPSRPPS